MSTGERGQFLSSKLIHAAVAECPDVTVPELLSVVLTLAKCLIQLVLESKNDEHNRSEIIRCLASLEQEVWERAPHEKVN